jgi:hypothetical protein
VPGSGRGGSYRLGTVLVSIIRYIRHSRRIEGGRCFSPVLAKSVSFVSPTAKKNLPGGVLEHRAVLARTGRGWATRTGKHLTWWPTW